jgi:hypothetical protein
MRQKLINRFYKFLRGIGIKESKTENINDFYDEVVKIAKSRGQDYVTVKVEKSSIGGYRFAAYYHSATWLEGNTALEALQKLQDFGTKKKVSPVENVIL